MPATQHLRNANTDADADAGKQDTMVGFDEDLGLKIAPSWTVGPSLAPQKSSRSNPSFDFFHRYSLLCCTFYLDDSSNQL